MASNGNLWLLWPQWLLSFCGFVKGVNHPGALKGFTFLDCDPFVSADGARLVSRSGSRDRRA